MKIKNLFLFTIAFFLVSCSDDASSMPEYRESLPFSLTDTDKDGLADRYENALGLVVGNKDASSRFLDPIYEKQWHLKNSMVKYEDINVASVWRETIGEKNITVAIVDTGVDANHTDLQVDLNNSFRYSDNSNDPSPNPSQLYLNSSANAHGTACAGIVAAKGWNSSGVRGVAPNINLVGLNVFSSPTDANFASALLKEGVDVSSNSWGGGGANSLYDDRTSLDAIESGVKTLRDTKGVVYVFAAGNDNANANFQSILASGFVIAVSSVDEYGVLESYSDFGANILISAPGGSRNTEYEPAIVTTDIAGLKYGMDVYKNNWIVDGNEKGDYTNTMNGTSASCPIVSGVVALMLSVNPALTYRDVQYILAKTARKNDQSNASWSSNAAGVYFSDKYGFGVVDANAAVALSKDFSTLGEEQISSQAFSIDELPESQKEVVYTLHIDKDFFVQSAQLSIKTDHDNCGKLKITLVSPSATESTLAYGDTVLYDKYNPWKLLSLQFLDESSLGEWRVKIEDVGFGNSVSSLELSLEIKGYKK